MLGGMGWGGAGSGGGGERRAQEGKSRMKSPALLDEGVHHFDAPLRHGGASPRGAKTRRAKARWGEGGAKV